MNLEEIRTYCLELGETEESFPFGPDTLVFKRKNKIYLLLSLDQSPLKFNVKCEPQLALEYRERYKAVQPGYHMNKTHWNTVTIDGSLKRSMLLEMINHSFSLVGTKKRNKTRKTAPKKGRDKTKKH